MRVPDPRRALAVAFGSSVLAVGLLGGGAQAVTPLVVTFGASPGSCVSGTSNHTPIDVQLYDDHDNLVDNQTNVPTGAGHRFGVCFAISGNIATGWSLVAHHGGDADVAFTIPSLTARVDRVTDVVKGTGGHDSEVKTRTYDCSVSTGTKDCPHTATRTVATDHQGHYSKDMTSAFNLRGYDSVGVTRTSAAGHTWTVFTSVPYMQLEPGTGFVGGALLRNQHATFKLRTHPRGSVLSSRSRSGGPIFGDYSLEFASHVTTGREVSSDFATDARITIPTTSTSFPIESGDQKIRTHCLPGRRASLFWDGPNGFALRTADSHGRIYVNLSNAETAGYRLPSASELDVYCENARGDSLVLETTVPER